MPTAKQIHAAAKVAIKYGCDKAHAEAMARYMLLAVENLDKGELFDIWPKNYLQQFWDLYPEKVGKGAVARELEKIKLGHEVTWLELLAGLDRYIERVNSLSDRQWCNPATWLNQKRWADQFAPVKENGRTTNGFAAIARQGI